MLFLRCQTRLIKVDIFICTTNEILYFSSSFLEAPAITRSPPEQTQALVGDTEVLPCEVTADPAATITWFRNAQAINFQESSRCVKNTKIVFIVIELCLK